MRLGSCTCIIMMEVELFVTKCDGSDPLMSHKFSFFGIFVFIDHWVWYISRKCYSV